MMAMNIGTEMRHRISVGDVIGKEVFDVIQ